MAAARRIRAKTFTHQKASRDGSIRAYTPLGQLVCNRHGKRLLYDTVSRPSRDGLRPGQPTDQRQFRLRGGCTHTTTGDGRPCEPCGRLGLRMMLDWRRLTRYPHHPHGDPRRYAMRQAMLARLNQAESFFNRLKSGLLLATEGEGRTRLRSRESVEALISVGCLGMTALMLADQRIQHGIDATTLPQLSNQWRPLP